ncbi:MAG: HypC/HybG/HupF family hydrogenase formation chaperone, partial [Acidimicrobiales bacterium]
MCLGIPGQLVELSADNDQLARVDITGVRRMINIGLLEDEVL